MGASIWDNIKKSLKDGLSVAAEKTEEYTRIGKLKVDILNIKRSLEKKYSTLGQEVYKLFEKKKQTDVGTSDRIKKIVAEIKQLKADLKAKETEIEKIKKETSQKKKTAEKKPPAPAKPKAQTPKKDESKSKKRS